MNKVNFTSFNEAILQNKSILEKKKSSWLGKKVYLGYSSKKGWKVYELGIFERCLRYLKFAYKDTHLKNVKDNLDHLTKQDTIIITKKLIVRIPKLNEKLQEVYNKNFKTVDVPTIHEEKPISQNSEGENPDPKSQPTQDQKSQPTQDPKSEPIPDPQSQPTQDPKSQPTVMEQPQEDSGTPLPPSGKEPKSETETPKTETPPQNEVKPEVIPPSLPSQSQLVEEPKETPKPPQVQPAAIEAPIVQADKFPLAVHPLKLANSVNSCYLDSVMELMLSQDHIRQLIFEARKNVSKERNVLAQELLKKEISLKHLQILKRNDFKLKKKEVVLEKLIELMEASSHRNSANSAKDIRKAIFESGLDCEFNLINPKNIFKQHDASSIMLLFLNDLLNVSFQTVQTDTIEGGKTFKRTPEINYSLVANLNNGENVLEKIIASQFVEECEPRQFTIDGVVKDFPYTKQLQILNMPEIMGIQLKRFKYNGSCNKKEDPLILPKDGIVDFSAYYGGDKPDSCRFEITGYVIHMEGGSLEFGHYVSNVKIGDKYFHCDDSTSSYSEISKEDFYGNENSYLLILKKIPAEPESEKPNSNASEKPKLPETEKQVTSPLENQIVSQSVEQNQSESVEQRASETFKPITTELQFQDGINLEATKPQNISWWEGFSEYIKSNHYSF